MPDRIIRESICTSETLNQLSDFEERFWHRLIVNCDDYGRFDARPAILKGRLFPLLEGKTQRNMLEAVQKLASVGLVELYEVEGKPFLRVVTWDKYQRIRAKRSKYPGPADICCQLPSNVAVIQSESESISESHANALCGKQKPPRFRKPTIEEIRAYCRERDNGIDAERFFDYYEARGWQVGKSPMKDWKAAVRTWEKNDRGDSGGVGHPTAGGDSPRYGTVL